MKWYKQILLICLVPVLILLMGAVVETWKHSGTPTQLVFCLSTDTKPTTNIRAGSELVETDTSMHFVYSGSAWVETTLQATFLKTMGDRWVVIDSTTSSGIEPNDLTETERTYQAVKTAIAAAQSGDGEISIFDVPRTWNAVKFRSIGLTADCSVKYEIYLGTLGRNNRDADSTTADCELAYAGQLAFTIGTQASTTTGYELADAVTITSSDWVPSWGSKTPGGNRVAEAGLDLGGADIIVTLATTADCDCKLLGKGY
ncbi:hypothetical protein LCGC14_1220080 [marine sediment metagenome]|uniref:Uncharacterized protein n=1 Tax=marine sediment metagenome TaxID=412755 RepID=A0A0F9PG51_9ZZZZ